MPPTSDGASASRALAEPSDPGQTTPPAISSSESRTACAHAAPPGPGPLTPEVSELILLDIHLGNVH